MLQQAMRSLSPGSGTHFSSKPPTSASHFPGFAQWREELHAPCPSLRALGITSTSTSDTPASGAHAAGGIWYWRVCSRLWTMWDRVGASLVSYSKLRRSILATWAASISAADQRCQAPVLGSFLAPSMMEK